MRLKKILLHTGIMLILTMPNEAMSQQRGLILLGELQQSVGLIYDYNGKRASYTNGRDFSLTEHRFEEKYHFDIPYGIYSHRLLKGHLSTDFSLNQEMFSASGTSPGTGSGFNFQYSIDGILLDRKPYPVSFFSNSSRNHVQREFSGGYDLITDSNGVGIFLKNRYLPVKANYSVINSKTSGQYQDRTQDTENISLGMSNRIMDLSQTDASIFHSENRSALIGGADSSRSTGSEYSIRNRLYWDGRNKELNSSYKLHESTGVIDNRYSVVVENFNVALGRSLDAGLEYENTHNRSMDQREVSNAGGAWLQHRLFQSLTTRLTFQIRDNEINDGSESDIGGSLVIGYKKRLPNRSNLALNFSQRVDVIDSKRDSDTALVVDEPLTARYFEQNVLINRNVVTDSIVVRSADPSKSSIRYTLGIDYWVELVGTQTRLIFLGSPTINDGDNLLVTYRYLVNPSIKYATYSRSIGGYVSFLDGRYRVFGGIDNTTQDLISGSDDVLRLGSQHSYRLGFDAKLENVSFGVQYLDYVSRDDKHQTVEGFASHDREFARGLLSLYMKDTYTMYEENPTAGAASSAYSENLVKLGMLYRKVLFGLADMKLKTDYAGSRGGPLKRDLVTVGLNVQVVFRNAIITFLSQMNWQDQGGNSTRDEQVRLELTRFF